jgi:hypothetical protein
MGAQCAQRFDRAGGPQLGEKADQCVEGENDANRDALLPFRKIERQRCGGAQAACMNK